MTVMTKLFSDRSAFIFELSKATPAGCRSVFDIFNYNLHVCMLALHVKLECIRRSEFKLYTYSARQFSVYSINAPCIRPSFVFYNFRKAVKLTENRDYSLQEGIPCYLLKQGELTFGYCAQIKNMTSFTLILW